MDKHTPGPWNLATVRTSMGVCHQIGPLGSSTKMHSACLYDDCYSDRARDMQLFADAHLIAASPELLEALRMVLKTADEETNWRKDGEMLREGTRYGVYLKAETLEQIDAAINKAEPVAGIRLRENEGGEE